MTTRIDTRFAQLKKEGRSAFVTFLMAGDPDPETSLQIIRALPQAGADIIEIGMPFTDPMADGPSIQAAGLRALKAGMTLKKTLAMVRAFREGDNATPLVLMGYYNPIYIYGVDKFLVDAKSAGVDGLIIVDLPPEEDTELCMPALKAGLNFIRLAGRCRRSGRAHQAAHKVAGMRRLRHPHARGRQGNRRARQRRGGGYRAGRCLARQPRWRGPRHREDRQRRRRSRRLIGARSPGRETGRGIGDICGPR